MCEWGKTELLRVPIPAELSLRDLWGTAKGRAVRTRDSTTARECVICEGSIALGDIHQAVTLRLADLNPTFAVSSPATITVRAHLSCSGGSR